MSLEATQTELGLTLIQNQIFTDNRGFFTESYNKEKFREIGINCEFVQDNISFSNQKHVLRGLHCQVGEFAQGKLISVLEGEIYDVAVHPNGTYEGTILNINTSAFIPAGYLHGFCVLSASATVLYKVTNFYNKAAERTVIWNDPTLNINWLTKNPIISEKDAAGISFKEFSS